MKISIAAVLYVVAFLIFWPLFQPQARVTVPAEIAVEIPVPSPKVEVRDFIRLDRISAYNPVKRQTDGDPTISSCGPNLEKQIAVSRDLFFDQDGRKHLCGTVVTVITDRGEVFGEYIVWDTMHQRYTNTADILFQTEDESVAFAFGITTGKLLIH